MSISKCSQKWVRFGDPEVAGEGPEGKGQPAEARAKKRQGQRPQASAAIGKDRGEESVERQAQQQRAQQPGSVKNKKQ